MTLASDTGRHLYESLADVLAGSIACGTLRPGDRLPSVRSLCRQYGVSVATVLQTYRLLEDRRQVDTRPRSGHFVARRLPMLDEPAPSRPPQAPVSVTNLTLLQAFLDALATPQSLNFGAALPHPEAFPTARLARLLSSHLRRHPEVTAEYRVGKGSLALRQVIARRALEAGVRVETDEIVITDGCMEALSLCLRAAARPGDVIALESPTYFLVLHTIQSLGMRVLEIPTHARDGLSVDALDLATQRHGDVKAVLVGPNFSNPLGCAMPDEQKARLVKLCDERGVAVIEDDVLGDTGFGPRRPPPAKAWDRSGNVMLCSSFSKTLAPGLRVGWAMPGRRLREVEVNKRASTIFTSPLAQEALAEFVGAGGYDHHMRRLRGALAERAMRFSDAIARGFPPLTRITRPRGGYNLWVELPGRVDAVNLFREAAHQGIVVAPGPIFTTSNRFNHCLRISYSHPWNAVAEQALLRLGGLARTARR